MFRRGETRRWRSARDVTWHVGRAQSGRVITIPAGREFESSVPWWAAWVVHPDDPRFLFAALIHDYMLEERILGRAQAAAEWRDAALSRGVSPVLAGAAFLAVAFWAVIWPDPVPLPDVK